MNLSFSFFWFLFCSGLCFGQNDDSNKDSLISEKSVQPSILETDQSKNTPTIKKYVLPIWGRKAAEMGYQLPPPFGLNAMMINTFVDMKVTNFYLSLGDGNYDKEISEIINVETLNFTEVSATFNGFNFRPDVWVLPFMNVYGIYTKGRGTTEVKLAPIIPYGDQGEVILFPEFGSKVEFTAETGGVGTTLVYGLGKAKKYFVSADANYSWTFTELLDDNVGVYTLSGRLGERFKVGKTKRWSVSAYVGFMYRNFSNTDGSTGQISLGEVFPGVSTEIDEKISVNTQEISENNSKISDLQTQIDGGNLSPIDEINAQKDIGKLEYQNTIAEGKNTALSKVQEGFENQLKYGIQKEMIQNVTVEFGLNLDYNNKFGIRSEFGVGNGQRLLITGIYYRFGI